MAAKTTAKKRPLLASETFWGYLFLPVIIGFLVFTIFSCGHVLVLQLYGL